MIPFIAERGNVSRAALYAALSGKHVPSRATVGMLVRWWAGEPSAELTPDDDDYFRDPDWGWIELLPQGHEGRTKGLEWWRRYDRLRRETEEGKAYREPTAPVNISVPQEQQRFIEGLEKLIESTGLKDDRWLLFGSFDRKVTRYLEGDLLPQGQSCQKIVMACCPHIGIDLSDDEDVEAFDRVLSMERDLEKLVEEARAARTRDRRAARGRTSA
ncbi:hypothetical protein ACFVZD_47045 [Streptomyces sp. NPDC058287]|uniref:hypothetical protein n=1 Tax=Streptomyces sp. NPDC058287 TaxID=3346423 RepID=UPI0036EEBE26